MKNITYIILCSLLAVVLCASMFQKTTHLFKFEPLKGVEVSKPMPALSYKSYSDGSFQSGTEAYLMQNFGFREPLLRCYNQYLWDLFRKTYVSRGILSFGKEGWLYEPWAVEDHYKTLFHQHAKSADEMTNQLAKEAKRVYQLQHILDSYDIKLFVSLVPSKDLIYPEYLPDNKNSKYDDEKKMSAREFYKEEYPKLGINLLNLEDYFLQMKDTANFYLFPKTATHWSRYAALFAADTLIRYAEHLGNINMRNLVFVSRSLEESQPADMDLEQLLNLIRPLPKPKYYYGVMATDKDTTAVMPRMLTIGDSFWWNVIYQIPAQQIFSSYPYWYYNSTIYYDPSYSSVKDVELVEEILSSDFINLFYSTTQLYRLNNDFTKKALLALCIDPEEIDSVSNALVQGIHNDSAWMVKLKKQSEKNGKTIEEAVYDEAQWLINNAPELYFSELNDSIPTKRSKQVDIFFSMDSTSFIAREVERTKNSIMHNEEQMNIMREKSVQQGKTLEQTINDDAHWIVNHKLENGSIQIPKWMRKMTQ